MAVEACGVLAEEVEILVPVGVDEVSAFAADDRERERRHVDHRARIAARHHRRALFVQVLRFRIALDVPALGRCHQLGQLGDDHGAAM